MNQIQAKIKTLIDLVDQNQKEGMVVCEVGVMMGGNIVEYGPIVKKNNGRILAVDHFRGNWKVFGAREDSFVGQKGEETYFQRFYKNIQGAGLLDIVEIYRMKSGAASKLIPNHSIDICFIDADHRYPAVYMDIENYLPKVKVGGILAGHDCKTFNGVGTFSDRDLLSDGLNGLHQGVIQAVYDHFGIIPILSDTSGWSWIKRL